MQEFPKVSIIIVSLNSERTIRKCLEYIYLQDYPNINEILLIDGGSSDNTFKIAKEFKLPIKIIKGGYKNNQEARRAVGVKKARNNLCAFIDTDNYITEKNWLKKMVLPLIKNEELVASQTLRYSAPKRANVLNRYFGLIGAGDPVAYYLKKSDRLSWMYDKWNLLGRAKKECKDYYIIEFNSDNFPTVGCNGIVFKKNILLKSKWGSPENYFHTDVFVDVAKLGYNKFAIVKNEVFHDTADTLFTFLKKRVRYMMLHHQNLKNNRRYFVFDKTKNKDLLNLLLFIFYSLTFVEPLLMSIKGFIKKRDSAWFMHPFICVGVTIVYAYATVYNKFLNLLIYKNK